MAGFRELVHCTLEVAVVLVAVIGMWIAFFAMLAADRLDSVQEWVRNLPLLAEVGLWLLAFPFLLAKAVWESSLAPLQRALLVTAFAIGWTLISLPRPPRPGEP